MLEYFLKNPWHAAILIAVLLVNVFFLGFVRTPAYAVYVDGKLQYVVRDRQEFDRLLKETVAAKEKAMGKKVTIANDIAYTVDLAKSSEILSDDQLMKELETGLDFQVSAVAVCVDEKPVVYMDSREKAETLLEGMRQVDFVCPEGETLQSVSFMEKVDIRDARVNENNVKSEQDARDIILAGSDNPEKHVVQEGDTVWSIAEANGVTEETIWAANNMKPGDYISAGQELLIVDHKPYINVMVNTSGEGNEPIPYDVKEEIDTTTTDQVIVKEAGEDGVRWVSYVNSYVNGVEAGRTVLEEKIVKEPVARVILKSENVRVAGRMGPGCLSWPVNGIITQYYKGKDHHGIDIGIPDDTPVLAADAGRVVFAGEQGGYGNFIIIDHGNGLITRYAHNNSFVVKDGDWVEKGQMISYSGNTGYSTGPHLHFEVIANGEVADPMYYLD